MSSIRFLIPVAVLGGLVALLWAGLGRDPGYVPSPLLGKPAPDFVLPRLDDPTRTISRSDLLGDVSIVNVWATWCVACREEHAFLVQLARTGTVRIYGLNWKDEPELAVEWLARLGNPYTATALDRDGRVAIDWGVYGAPETFLLDATGLVLYKHIAPLTPAVWEREFVPRINRARGEGGT
jgi:cytochrome c biogenesis protein CcmG/thiol:disulfide interchange protein DsbE